MNFNGKVCMCVTVAYIYQTPIYGRGWWGGGGEEGVTPLWSISLVKSTPFRIDPRSALYSTNVRRKAQSGHFILQRS